MNITKNVLNDLLPAYLSGEASQDTTSLIEEFMRSDAAFANEVRAQRSELTTQIRALRASKAALGPDHELQTLSRTRAMLERRKWLLAVALMFTAFPCSFVFDGGGIRFLLLRDQPALAIACWVAATGFWVGLLSTRRKLKGSGL
jgi:anti-sigma factor RsiW